MVRQGNTFYAALDNNGSQVLYRIANFREPPLGSVTDLFRAYEPLIKDVDVLAGILIDYPFCIAAGEYTNTGVLCRNLKGCFDFDFLDRSAPLGFQAYINMPGGGVGYAVN